MSGSTGQLATEPVHEFTEYRRGLRQLYSPLMANKVRLEAVPAQREVLPAACLGHCCCDYVGVPTAIVAPLAGC